MLTAIQAWSKNLSLKFTSASPFTSVDPFVSMGLFTCSLHLYRAFHCHMGPFHLREAPPLGGLRIVCAGSGSPSWVQECFCKCT